MSSLNLFFFDSNSRISFSPLLKSPTHLCDAVVLPCHEFVGCPKHEESQEFVETKKFTPSEQQMEVLHAIARGKSVFVTGSAGTGKSFILADALQCLREKFGNDAVFITASTGLAACSLGGTTLNTFAGVGFGKGSKEALLKQVSFYCLFASFQ